MSEHSLLRLLTLARVEARNLAQITSVPVHTDAALLGRERVVVLAIVRDRALAKRLVETVKGTRASALPSSRPRATDSVEGAMYSTGRFSCTFFGTKNLTGC